MRKNMKKLLSGVSSAAMLASGAAQVAVAETGYEVAVNEAAAEYVKVANVQGAFDFNQDNVTPANRMFNLFGTAVTGMCAKPNYELEAGTKDYYLNVGGKIAKAYTVNIKEEKAQSRVALCSCATGPATANVEITGVKLADVLQLAEMDADVNTVTAIGADGYKASLPLSYALEKEAMIVYKVNNEKNPTGMQFWVPGTVAKYFTRNVVDIELTAEAEVPEVAQREDALRAEIAIVNRVEGNVAVGEEVTFEGYADDCGDAIAAVEFSMDGGKTWTAYETAEATADRWVYWSFSFTPEAEGEYELCVRARTESGNVSPLAANVTFTAAEAAV